MDISLFKVCEAKEIIDLFTSVFSDSEGEPEGTVIGRLVSEIIENTDSQDLIGCVASASGKIVGCIFFSRFVVPNGQRAFILSPAAVSTNQQGKGVGQALINYGLSYLKSKGVELVFTYGDPNYYSKTGFNQISESTIKAPFQLSHPEGWLAQSLSGSRIQAMQGQTECVGALSDQTYW